jgi:hypothetical protein
MAAKHGFASFRIRVAIFTEKCEEFSVQTTGTDANYRIRR